MVEQAHDVETKYALFQHTQVTGHNTLDFLRELGESELHEIRSANTVAREAAWNTPHHALAEGLERAQAALLEVVAETTESLDVRKGRFATAVEGLLTAATTHATDWVSWLADVTPPDNPVDADTVTTPQDLSESGPVATLADSSARFEASDPVKTAHALITAPDFAVKVIPDEVPDAELLSPSNGICVRLSDWNGTLAPELTLLAHAGFELIQPQLDRASKVIHAIFAESPAGSPVIAPEPSPTDGWTTRFTLESVDVGAARAAQSLALQARSLASDITRSEDRKRQPDSPTAPAPEAPVDASTTLDGEGAAQTGPASLTSVVLDLHRIVDALGRTLDGLASAWAQRFPAQEYIAALQVETQQASSLLLPIQRAIESQGVALKDVGHAGELPGYPLQPGEVAAWSSEASHELLWTYESTALMHALHQHVQALEDLGIPARLAIAGGSVTTLEFEPLRTGTLRASGHLIARLTSEVSSTTASMVDGTPTTHVPATQTDDLRRAAMLSLSLGLPEAVLIYVIRLCDALTLDLSEDEEALIETARREVGGYVSGRPTSIGVVHILADSLFRIVDRHSAHLGQAAESSSGN